MTNQFITISISWSRFYYAELLFKGLFLKKRLFQDSRGSSICLNSQRNLRKKIQKRMMLAHSEQQWPGNAMHTGEPLWISKTRIPLKVGYIFKSRSPGLNCWLSKGTNVFSPIFTCSGKRKSYLCRYCCL